MKSSAPFVVSLLCSIWASSAQMLVDLSPLKATLSLNETNRGWFTLRIENKSGTNVTFVDIPEGAGNCDEYYFVSVVGKRKELLRRMVYQPSLQPKAVRIPPRGVYLREIQPRAYVAGPNPSEETYEVTIAYKIRSLTEKENLRKKFGNVVDLDVEFKTPALRASGKDFGF